MEASDPNPDPCPPHSNPLEVQAAEAEAARVEASAASAAALKEAEEQHRKASAAAREEWPLALDGEHLQPLLPASVLGLLGQQEAVKSFVHLLGRY